MTVELIAGALTGIVSFLGKSQANSTAALKEIAELNIKAQMTAGQLANSAAKRSNPKARKILAYMIVGTFVCGLLAIGIASLWKPDAVVSIIKEVPQKSLLGVFKWGKTFKVVEASGFVLPEWTGMVVTIVVGYFFGTGAAKGRG